MEKWWENEIEINEELKEIKEKITDKEDWQKKKKEITKRILKDMIWYIYSQK